MCGQSNSLECCSFKIVCLQPHQRQLGTSATHLKVDSAIRTGSCAELTVKDPHRIHLWPLMDVLSDDDALKGIILRLLGCQIKGSLSILIFQYIYIYFAVIFSPIYKNQNSLQAICLFAI